MATYYTQEQIDSSSFKDFCCLTTPGWYFWDESGSIAHGPFDSENEAEEAERKYEQYLDRDPAGDC